MKGDTNIKYLNDNGVTIWDEWADDSGELGSLYGKQWVDWGGTYETLIRRERDESGHFPFVKKHNPGINQVRNAIELLRNDPDSRRNVISAWNVGELEQMKLVPCHNFFQVYTRELSLEERNIYYTSHYLGLDETSEELDRLEIPKREISLMWNQRSVDTFLGLPFNIASYALLLEMFAQQTNMVPGELVGNLGDVHIYNNHIDYVEKQLKRESKECKPRLLLNKADSLFDYKFEDFELLDYQYHSNWANVPIAV